MRTRYSGLCSTALPKTIKENPGMYSLGGMIVLCLIAIVAGKRSIQMKKGAYLLMLLLAALQTGVILIDMFNREIPTS